jgi:hypothetical protein
MDNVSLLIAAIIYIAIIYTLVRPNSKGPTIVKNTSTMLSDLVRGATGQTYNGTSWSASS